MSTAVDEIRSAESLAALVEEVVLLIAQGVSQREAVASTLRSLQLAPALEFELLCRGLQHEVVRARNDHSRGVSEMSAFRPQVVAPGKKSEWTAFELAYPTLSSVTFLIPRGQLSLGQFRRADWDWLEGHARNQARNAIARTKAAALAKQLFTLRDVKVTSELPAADLAALEKAAEKAWRS